MRSQSTDKIKPPLAHALWNVPFLIGFCYFLFLLKAFYILPNSPWWCKFYCKLVHFGRSWGDLRRMCGLQEKFPGSHFSKCQSLNVFSFSMSERPCRSMAAHKSCYADQPFNRHTGQIDLQTWSLLAAPFDTFCHTDVRKGDRTVVKTNQLLHAAADYINSFQTITPVPQYINFGTTWNLFK